MIRKEIRRRGVGQSIYFPLDLYEEMVEAAQSYSSLAKFVQEAVKEKIENRKYDA